MTEEIKRKALQIVPAGDHGPQLRDETDKAQIPSNLQDVQRIEAVGQLLAVINPDHGSRAKRQIVDLLTREQKKCKDCS